MIRGYIYIITNKFNNKSYIGQTINIKNRFNLHIALSRRKKGYKIHHAISKYGEKNFEFSILMSIIAIDIDTLNDLLDAAEIYYIKKYNSIDSGYNILNGGNGVYNRNMPQEIRDRISKARKGIKLSEEHKRKINPKGRKLSEEARKRLSEARKGKKFSPEHIASIKNYQSHRTKEHQENLTNSLRNKMKLLSKEEKKQIYSHKLSDEAKAKISKSKVLYWNNLSTEDYEILHLHLIEMNKKRAKMACKAIEQYDMNNNLIRSFNSIKEASIYLNLKAVNISCALTKRQKSAGGYIWKYKEKEVNNA